MTNAMMEIVNPPTKTPSHWVVGDQPAPAGAWDRLHAGLLVVDGDLHVHSMNVAARTNIGRDDGFALIEARFTPSENTDGNRLAGALETAARGQVGALAIWSTEHDEPYLLTAVQLESPSPARPRQQFLVTIADPLAVPAEPVLKCARALGLTQGEACLALALVRGETVTENAARRGVSVHTVRSQLRNIRDKLGLRRQSQLISWLTRAALSAAPYPRPSLPRLAEPTIRTRPQAAVV